jgi:chromosome segregation ATPase
MYFFLGLSKVRILEAQITDLESQLREKQSSMFSLEAELDSVPSLRLELAERNKKIEAFAKELAILNEDDSNTVGQLNAELKFAGDLSAAKEAELEGLRLEIEALKNGLEQARSSVGNDQELAAGMAVLERQLLESNQITEEWQSYSGNLEAQVTEANHQLQTMTEDFHDQSDSLKLLHSKIETMHRELEAANEQIGLMQDQASASNVELAEKKTLEKQITDLESQLIGRQNSLMSLEAELETVATLRIDVAARDEQIAGLNDELHSLSGIAQRYKLVEREKENVMRDLDDAMAEKSDLGNNLYLLKQNCDDLKSQLDGAFIEKDSIIVEYTTLLNELRLQKDNTVAEAELRVELAGLVQEKESIITEYTKLLNELRLQKDNIVLEKESVISQYAEYVEGLEYEKLNLLQQLEQTRTGVSDIGGQQVYIDGLRSEVGHLTTLLNERIKSENEVRSQLDEAIVISNAKDSKIAELSKYFTE